jgi:hypothetical protein
MYNWNKDGERKAEIVNKKKEEKKTRMLGSKGQAFIMQFGFKFTCPNSVSL